MRVKSLLTYTAGLDAGIDARGLGNCPSDQGQIYLLLMPCICSNCLDRSKSQGRTCELDPRQCRLFVEVIKVGKLLVVLDACLHHNLHHKSTTFW